jgi:signal transduction histidine kinase
MSTAVDLDPSRPVGRILGAALVTGVAAAAVVALENARLRDRVRELATVANREQQARDLHDTVIQRLFAAGLALHQILPLASSDPDAAAGRIEQVVDDLDVTVEEIRSVIFAPPPPGALPPGSAPRNSARQRE